jgi:hypothetical protein
MFPKIASVLILIGLFFSGAVYAYANPAAPFIGSSGNYVILAETTITDTGVTGIVGDIASSGTGAAIGVPCSDITGTIYDVDGAYTGGGGGTTVCRTTASTDVGNAVLAMTNGYTNALIPTPDLTNTNGGNLGGLTLTRGVYAFNGGSGNVIINGGNLTLAGSADDVWIFQIEGTFRPGQDLGNENVVLTGGAQAKNVYWAVAGETTIFPGSSVSGIILDAKGIAMQLGSTLNGRALAQTAVTLIGNNVSIPVIIPPVPVPLSNSSNNVTGCLEVNTPGAYRMTAPLFGANISASPLSDTACVKIVSNDVVFDCNNFRISNNGTGGTTYGILVTNTSRNVSVFNCPGVSQYEYGVEVYLSNNTKFVNLITNNNSGSGFIALNSSNNTVTNAIGFGNGVDTFAFVNTNGGTNALSNVNAHDNGGEAIVFVTTDSNAINNSIAIRNNGQAFVFVATGANTMANSTAINNTGPTFLFVITGANTVTRAFASGNNGGAFSFTDTGANIVSNATAHDNNGIAFYFNNAPQSTVTGSTAYNNVEAFDIISSNNTILNNNTAFNQTVSGALVLSSNNTTIMNHHLYNNNPDLSVVSGGILNLSGVIFDNPLGNLRNFTTLSVYDVIDASYYINWSAQPAPLPSILRSVANKYVDIEGSGTIDNAVWSWGSEVGALSSPTFQLWYYDGINWTNTTAQYTPSNKLVISNISAFGVYAILAPNVTSNETSSGNNNHGGNTQLSMSISPSCSGNVVTVSNSAPLEGATVTVDGSTVGTTDSNGQVTFTGCGATSTVYARATGYVSASEQVTLLACSQCQTGGCSADSDCLSTQMCSNSQCVDVSCPNGQVTAHKCVPNQVNQTQPEECNAPSCCTSSAQCASNQTCSIAAGTAKGSCQQVIGQCGYVANHAWVAYPCGTEANCPQCGSGQSCMNNKCVPFGVSCQSSGTVGATITCQLTQNNQPCANCDATVTAPDGTKSAVSADSSGNVLVILISPGDYQISNGPSMTKITSSAKPVTQPVEPTKPAAASGPDYLCWAGVILLLIAIGGGIYYWTTMKKK